MTIADRSRIGLRDARVRLVPAVGRWWSMICHRGLQVWVPVLPVGCRTDWKVYRCAYRIRARAACQRTANGGALQ